MLRAKNGRCFLGVIAVLILTGPAAAQLIEIVKFKGVEIPYTLKFEDRILEKGPYDLDTLKNPTTPSCYLRFKKKGTIICLVEGERLDYRDQEVTQTGDSAIPQKPRLKMKRNTAEKVFIFTVETGLQSKFPSLWLRFKLEYED